MRMFLLYPRSKSQRKLRLEMNFLPWREQKTQGAAAGPQQLSVPGKMPSP